MSLISVYFYVQGNSVDMDGTEYDVEHVVFAVLLELYLTSTALFTYYRSTPHHDPVLLHDRNQKINNKQLGQTLHGDAIYVTILFFGQVMTVTD